MIKKYDNRDNCEKWALPDLASAYDIGVPISFEDWLDDPIPNSEKRKKYGMPLEDVHDERTETYEVSGCPEEPDAPLVRVQVTYPKERKKKMPCIFVIPGGGLILSFAAIMNSEQVADDMDAVVVKFNYRCLFDDATYPAPINDCHAVYKWLVENGADMQINTKRIVLYGISTGGHLALSLSHRLKRYGYHPRGCVAIGPVTDNRMIYPCSRRTGNTWNSPSLYRTARMWLGEKGGNDAFLSPEAFPNHADPEDCEGLPPTVIYTYEADVCVDPSLQYASKLIEAGVYTQLYVWGGQNHICNFNCYCNTPDDPQAAIYLQNIKRDFDILFNNDLRRLWQQEEAK